MRAPWMIVVVAACGRVSFSPLDDGGGLGDGAPGDGVDPDALAACKPSYNVCDTFEAPTIDTDRWGTDPIVIDAIHTHRGEGAAHIQQPAFVANSNSYIVLAEKQTLITAQTFWVRAWLWLSALPAGQNGLELVTAQRPSASGDYFFVFSDATHVYSEYDDQSSPTPVTVPVASWFCVVFNVARATTATGSILATGDVNVPLLANVRTDSATQPLQFITIGFGFSATNTPVAQPALDLWIDDVIIDDAPVTCAD